MTTTIDETIIVGLGEVLWDVLPDSEEIGGAPINFAYHVNALGRNIHAIGVPVSTIGNDERGKKALQELAARNMRTDCISTDPDHETGYVAANVDEKGVAHYVFPDNIAWDNMTLNKAARTLAKSVRAVCFGTLGQRSETARSAIREFLAACPADCLKVFDVNLRQNFFTHEVIEQSLEIANAMKISDEEIGTVASMFGISGTEREVLESFRVLYNLHFVVLTRGEKGSLYVSEQGEFDHTGLATSVDDTIGAGDSFTAATVLGYLQGASPEEISSKANRVAAYVCTKPGGMPEIPDELLFQASSGE